MREILIRWNDLESGLTGWMRFKKSVVSEGVEAADLRSTRFRVITVGMSPS